jgi:dihydroorotase
MDILITGGRIIDPGRFDGPGELLIAEGRIAALTPAGSAPASKERRPGVRVIDASGKVVTPGLVDIHVHLREPGYEHKETIASGCHAAVSGGFTAVCCMANTNPVNDSPQVTQFIRSQAEKAGLARVYPVAAVTKGLLGRELCDFRALKAAGAAALSDDGRPLLDSRLLRRALETSGLPVIGHCEDPYLAEGGVMNEGPAARELGVTGIPNACESIMVIRDIALSELTGAPVHIAHVSTAESIRAIREAKARGVGVTAETAPHYFTLTDAAVIAQGAAAKMNPPLRSEQDRQAVRAALADGTLDCIATDHAPHAQEEKAAGLAQAPNGIIGLETAFPISMELVREGVVSLPRLVALLSTAPAAIMGLPCGLYPGALADVALLDPEIEFVITLDLFKSRSRNSPFIGRSVRGRAAMTIVGGRVVFE